MFAELVLDPGVDAQAEALITPRGATTWGVLADRARRFELRFREPLDGARVGVSLRAVPDGFALLAALDRLRADVFLIDGELPRDTTLAMAERFRLSAVLTPSAAGRVDCQRVDGGEPALGGGSVTLLTSGTTGDPKAARHTWSSLARPTRRISEQLGARWLLTYRPQLYAGLQVILQCMVNRGTLALPDPDADPATLAEFMREARVRYVSATPSYWRRLLLLAAPAVLREVDLRQITLGGEVVDQQVLDTLRDYFPTARIVHIYATTELGRCFSVSDGLAGFPARFLAQPSADGVELSVVDGELMVRSANAMQGYDRHSAQPWVGAGWVATGDLVEIAGDRVRFVGRRSERINVGGNKVHPTEVERVIRELPGVADVVVYGKRSSLAGELVACDVVAAPEENPERLRQALAAHCAARLAAHQRPRLVRLVEQIHLSKTGKKVRGAP